jgi:hypothetical protein
VTLAFMSRIIDANMPVNVWYAKLQMVAGNSVSVTAQPCTLCQVRLASLPSKGNAPQLVGCPGWTHMLD